jgi:uncharacterized protein (DUF1800 family)
MTTWISAIGLIVATSLCNAQTVPTMKVSPATASLRAGAQPTTQTFKVTETNVKTPSTTFTWALTGAAGVTGSLGAINSAGVYTPPAVPPTPNTVTVTATDVANKLSSTAVITILDPAPVITSLSSYNINTGLFYTIDVKGTGFMPTYKVMLDSTQAKSSFISSTDIQIAGTSSAPAGTKITVTVVDPSTTAGGKTSNATTLNVLAPVAVTVSPDNRTIRCGTTTPLQMTARVINNSNQAVTWQVNGVSGGNNVLGTISSTGAYTPPLNLPGGTAPATTSNGTTTLTPVTVKITALSTIDPTKSASVNVTLQNPTPSITSVTPNPVNVTPDNPTPVNLTVTGTGFAQGAVIYFAGAALPTSWINDTKLTASATLALPVGGRAGVKVANPNPGALTSTPVVIPVSLPAALVKMPYADAVRFLQMATFGPTPASVAHLQAIGRDAWLNEQFAMPASEWPNPLSDNEGLSRLQTAFFNIAMSGQDQLRQRVSFALAQIMVASGVKDQRFSQMVGYQRLLGDSAFGSFRKLLGDMTLNPAMGYFLDMVNNDKANSRKNTVANENYAREVMQLFTIGLVQLNNDGTPATGAPPEYTQATVTDMAKVMTGWTYAPAPGYAGQWPNPPYWFQPMVPFESHHDQTQKVISLPIPCIIGAGGTSQSDLDQALDCLVKQQSAAPFIAYRLIQRLVKSNPSPGYVSDVANVFRATGGNLQAVVRAILTHGEALTPGSGKLAEPILYATNLLRALNANVTEATGVNSQTTAMGQNAMSPASVFSYFSPFYRTMGVPAPEFQSVNAATSLARANFAWRAVTNGISGNIRVDLTNLQDVVSANPNELVEAINQALYRGLMDSNVRAILLAAAKGSTSSLANVRSAFYAAAAAPQYQVQQ